MAGNEASEKLSWPWRKRENREGGGREKERSGGKQSHHIATATRQTAPCVGFISRGPARQGGSGGG